MVASVEAAEATQHAFALRIGQVFSTHAKSLLDCSRAMFRELRVAVVIPAFNEELDVARTVRDVPGVRRSRARRRRRVARSPPSARRRALRAARARGAAPSAQSRRRRGDRDRLSARARARRRRRGGDGRRRADGSGRSAGAARSRSPTARADYVKGNRFARRRRLARDAAGAHRRQHRAVAGDQADERLLARVRFAVRLHRGVAARARGDRRGRAVSALRLSERSAGAAARGRLRVGDVPVRAVYGPNWRSGIRLVDGGVPDVVRAAALVGAAARRRAAPPIAMRGAASGGRSTRVRIGVLTTSYPRDDGRSGGRVRRRVRALARGARRRRRGAVRRRARGRSSIAAARRAALARARAGPRRRRSRAHSLTRRRGARAAGTRWCRTGWCRRARSASCRADGRTWRSRTAPTCGCLRRLPGGRALVRALGARGRSGLRRRARCASTARPGAWCRWAIDVRRAAATTASARAARRALGLDGFVVAVPRPADPRKGRRSARSTRCPTARRCSSPATGRSAPTLAKPAWRAAERVRFLGRGARRAQARAARGRRCAGGSLARRRRADGDAGSAGGRAADRRDARRADCPSCSATRRSRSLCRRDARDLRSARAIARSIGPPLRASDVCAIDRDTRAPQTRLVRTSQPTRV